MSIRLPKIPRPEEVCGATQPAGVGQSEPAAQSSRLAVGPSVAHAPRWRRATRIHSNRATAAPASQTPGAPKSYFSAIVVGVSDRKPSPQTRHRAPWPRNLKVRPLGFAVCLCDTPFNHLPGLGTPTESVPHLPVEVKPIQDQAKVQRNRLDGPDVSRTRRQRNSCSYTACHPGKIVAGR